MEITQAMQEAMVLSLVRRDKTPQGVECSFFQFGTVGVKFYGYGRSARDAAAYSFRQQERCYASGLAPKPGEMFCIYMKNAGKDSDHLELHGYTTEVAIVTPGLVPEAEQYDLRDRLSAAGLPSGDLHTRNIGYVVDEATDTFKLVPIDFGYHFG